MTAPSALVQWTLPAPVAIDHGLLTLFPENPVFVEVLLRRGFQTLEQAQAFLFPRFYTQSDPFDFPGMQTAVEILLNTIRNGKSIGVCGDFDVDGLSATAILVEGLLELTPDVHYQLPSRSRQLHGISQEAVRALADLGVQTLITCDTGISENTGIQYARSLGMQVIVTDHHRLPKEPVNASVIITPEHLPETHPMRNLSGSGVAYKLIEALFNIASRPGPLNRYADLAAIGIVGDLVPLTGEARFLVQTGIGTLQNMERPGLLEICKCANITIAQISEKIITHVIGPRLNSLSRIVDGNAVVELLTTRDPSRAQLLAQLAEQANTNRRQITDSIQMAAQNQIDLDRSLLDKPILYMENDDWHFSVLGLVASQLADRYARPVVLISSFDENLARGSARSVPGIDITAVIAENADMLEQFGGHSLAAGFSIKKDRLVDFRCSLMTAVPRMAAPAEPLEVDAALPLWETTRNGFCQAYQLFKPFGPGNPPIRFMAEDIHFLESVPFGKNMQHLRLNVATRKLTRHSLVYWNGAGKQLPPDHFDLVYQISNQKSGNQSEIQITLEDFRPHEKSAAVPYPRSPALQVNDWRSKSLTDPELKQQAQQSDTIVFAEGFRTPMDGIAFKTRQQIAPCRVLILLTCPAGYDVIINLLNQASPEIIDVVGLPSDLDQKTIFMQTVTEYILGAIRTAQGCIDLPNLAAITGQKEDSIRLAVEWLVNKTTLQYKVKNATEIVLDRSGAPGMDAQTALEELEKSLEETAAFKRFFKKTDLQNFFSNLEFCPR